MLGTIKQKIKLLLYFFVNNKFNHKYQIMNYRYTQEIFENTICLKVEAWVSLKKDTEANTNRHSSKLLKRIKQMTFDCRNVFNYDDKYIIDLDLRTSGLAFGKKSYMGCQIMLSENSKPRVSFGCCETEAEQRKIDVENYLEQLNSLFENDSIFSFSPNK